MFNTNVSNSHSCPIKGRTNWSNRDKTLPTGYPGWHGRISGNFKSPKGSKINKESISDFLKNTFLVFNTGTGCGGQFNYYEIDIELSIFLDDFPILKEKYDIYKENAILEMDNRNLNKKVIDTAYEIAYNNFKVLQYNVIIEDLNNTIEDTVSIKSNLIKDIADDYIGKNPPELKEVCSDFEDLKQIFKSNFY